MNDKDRKRYEACKRSGQYALDYKTGYPAAGELDNTFLALNAKVNEIEAATGGQSAAIGTSGQQFQLKDIDREELNDIMTAVANAARAAEPTNPGTQERFRFNRNLNDADLLAAANSFLAATAAEQALLINWSAPATWHADLTAEAAEFDAAFSAAASADQTKVASTAEVKQLINEAMQLKRTAGHMVPNYFGDDPGAMAAWHSASTVEKDPKPTETP